MEVASPFYEQTESSKITDDTLLIPQVYIESIFEVDEEGVKEARRKSEMKQIEPIKFICNRPFMFLIHDKGYENVLFIGKFFHPNFERLETE